MLISGDLQIFISMACYILVVIAIGLAYRKKANENSDNFYIGGRTLGPWVAAMSAEASDMSGWLLMGLPGVAYWFGLSDAFWTALGLAVGTYLNWLLVAKRLRRYSAVANNSITIPEFFSNRFHDKSNIIIIIASLFILVFFSVYTGSCFVTCGKLFAQLFDIPYVPMMILGAVFVIAYTVLGGFLAESVSDFMQGIVMIVALSVVVITGTVAAGGIGAVLDNARSIGGFLDFFGIASPTVGADGVQQVVGGKPLFGEAGSYGLLTVISTASWGLGYFGVPQVLLRFMAIRKSNELTRSRRIATIWVVISLSAAVFIGLVGRSLYPIEPALITKSGAENVFIHLSESLLPPLLAGIVMAGILAATISSADSYLLIASSAISKDLYKNVFKKDATEKQIMLMSRITLILISVFGIIIALDSNSVIFNIVSFAWAGFGATFGPIMLFSLFWKRTTKSGAIAGMLGGGAMVFIWEFLLGKLGGIFTIYELMPAFIFSCILIVIVSLLTKEPSDEIKNEFEMAKTYDC